MLCKQIVPNHGLNDKLLMFTYVTTSNWDVAHKSYYSSNSIIQTWESYDNRKRGYHHFAAAYARLLTKCFCVFGHKLNNQLCKLIDQGFAI